MVGDRGATRVHTTESGVEVTKGQRPVAWRRFGEARAGTLASPRGRSLPTLTCAAHVTEKARGGMRRHASVATWSKFAYAYMRGVATKRGDVRILSIGTV